MISVKQTVFIDTLIDNGAAHSIDRIAGIVCHVVSNKNATQIIPLLEEEDILGQEAAIYLAELRMLYLLPFLVPDHPAAEMAKSLPRD